MPSLPSDRTKLAAAQGNQVPSAVIASKKNIDAITEAYDTIDALYNFALSLVTSGTLSPLPPEFMNRQIAINPNFDIWQDGSTFSSNGYFADQFYFTGGVSFTLSRQTASPPIGSSAYLRMTANALGGYAGFGQAFESDICNKLKGQTVSLSILIRKDPTFDGQIQLQIEKNAVADTSAGTWVNVATSAAFSLSTSWALCVLQNVSIPTDANGLRIQFAPTGGTRPAGSYVEFAQCQFNTGATANTFQPRSFSDELQLCQRYYEKSYDYATFPGAASYAVQPIIIGVISTLAGSTAGNVGGACLLPFKVRKRVNPTATLYDFDGTVNAVRVINTDAKRSGVTAIANLKDTGTFQFLSVDGSSATAISVGNIVGANWKADARL